MSVTKINKGEILNLVESTQIKENIPNFDSGDTIIVHNRIIEGKKSRIQKFEGVAPLPLRRRTTPSNFWIRRRCSTS